MARRLREDAAVAGTEILDAGDAPTPLRRSGRNVLRGTASLLEQGVFVVLVVLPRA